MLQKQKDFIYQYWNRTEFGRKILSSNFVSEDDLFFLIPNNVKHLHGLPTSRVEGKRKAKTKILKRREILCFKLWDLLEEVVNETIGTTFNDDYFNQFVEVKNLDLGEPVRLNE